MKKVIIFIFFVILLISGTIDTSYAQYPGCDLPYADQTHDNPLDSNYCPDNVPLDEDVVYLVIATLVFGFFKIYTSKNTKSNTYQCTPLSK